MKPAADNKKRKLIPAHVPPAPERVCIPVRVPDDEEYIALFMGALFELTKQMHYDRDEAHQARLVAEVWKQVYAQVQASLEAGEQCDNLTLPDDGCIEYLPSAPFLQYAPNDPFQTPNLIPSGYLIPPFYTNPLIPLPSVQPTDAMVNFASIPVSATLPELLSVGLPRVRIPFQGAGEVEIELVKIPQGGIALLTMDGLPDAIKVVDLNSVAIVGLPALEDILDILLEENIAETEVIEWKTEAAGAHFIDVTFLPNVGGEILLGFGGGLRRVSFCAGATIGDVPVPEFRITDCDLEWRPSAVGSWENLGNVCGADGTNGTNGANGASGADADIPIGCIIMHGSGAIPNGWLQCSGQEVSRSTYSALFTAIGSTFGNGNGTTTFNVPDFRQRSPRGTGTGLGVVITSLNLGDRAGEDGVELELANIPPHHHTIPLRKSAGAFGTANAAAAPTTSGTLTTVDSDTIGGSGGSPTIAETMPRVTAVTFIIKAFATNTELNIEFRVVDCQLEWRKQPSESFVPVEGGDLTACTVAGDNGATPEIRLVPVDADTYKMQYHYIGMPDDPEFWFDAGTFDVPSGVIGSDGRTPQIRMVTMGNNFYSLQWKYTDDPDTVLSWRIAGFFHTGGDDAEQVPSPVETEHDNMCGIAFLVSGRMTSLLDDLMEVWDGSVSLADAFTNALALLTDSVGIGFLITGVITQLESIANAGTAVIREDLTFAQIEAATQQLFCDLVTFGYSYNLLASWARNMYNNPSTGVGLKAWAFMVFVLNSDYWDATANIGAQSPSNLCEDNPCDDFNQPARGIEFEFKAGETFEQNPTYQVNVVLRFDGGGQIGDEITVHLRDIEGSALNGVDYEFTPSSITFPAVSLSGAKIPISVAINNDEAVSGTRKFQLAIDSITTLVDNVHIGQIAYHVVTIYDNDDLQLVIRAGNGANLTLVAPNVYEVESVGASTTWRAQLVSAIDDIEHCWRLVSVEYLVGTAVGSFFRCGSGAANGGTPAPTELIHAFWMQGSAFFKARVTIEPE